MTPQPVISIVTGLPRPRWRGRIHTYAFLLSIPAGIVLLLSVDKPAARVGVAVYGGALAAVFGVSAAYHRLAHSDRAQRVMQRLDHSMIYLLIAGTYTPVCVVALPLQWWIPLLAVVWAGCVFGIWVKVWEPPRLSSLSNALYLVLGWVAIVALPVFVTHVSPGALFLMVLGGVLYSVGAAVFYRRRPDPVPAVFGYHEVWHVFTVLAGASHYGMVALVAVA